MAGKKPIVLDSTRDFEQLQSGESLSASGYLLNDTEYGMTLDGSNNLILTDAVTGTKTLAELGADGSGSGSGTGSLSTFVSLSGESPEVIGDWSTGNNATYLGGGSIAGTFVFTASTPLHSANSFLYTQASESLNDYVASASQTVPIRSRGKLVAMKIPYLYDGGDADIQAVVWDVTNSNKLTTTLDIFASKTGSSTFLVATVFMPANCASIRVGTHTLVENIGAILKFDDIEVSDDPLVIKEIMNLTDWKVFTPTGAWVSGNETYTGAKRQVGDTAEYSIKVIVGAGGPPTASALYINLPSGEVIDTDKLTNDVASNGIIGRGTVLDSGSAVYKVDVYYKDASSVEIRLMAENVDGSFIRRDTLVSDVWPMTFTTNDTVWIDFKVPIVGWTATTENVVSALESVSPVRYQGTGSTLQAVSTGTYTFIDFNTKTFDDQNLVSGAGGGPVTSTGTGWYYTCPSDGIYSVDAQLQWQENNYGGGSVEYILNYIYQNGAQKTYNKWENGSGGSDQSAISHITDLLTCSKGDRIEIATRHNMGTTRNLINDFGTKINITKVDQNATLGLLPSNYEFLNNIPVQMFNATEWESFTPIGTWNTNATYTGYKRRVGDTLELQMKITLSGAPNAASLQFTLPDSLSVDTDKYFQEENDPTFGTAVLKDNSTGNRMQGVAAAGQFVTQIKPLVYTDSGSYEHISQISQTVPFTWAANDEVHLHAKVPIKGWTATSEHITLPAEIIKPIRYKIGSAKTLTNNSSTKINFDTQDYDDNNFVTNAGSDWRYVTPSSGIYNIYSVVSISADTTVQVSRIDLYINGTQKVINWDKNTAFAIESSLEIQAAIELEKDDYVEVKIYHELGTGVTAPFYAGLDTSYIEIKKIDQNSTLNFIETDKVRNLTARQFQKVAQAQNAMTGISTVRFDLSTAIAIDNNADTIFSVSDDGTRTLWTANKDCTVSAQLGGYIASTGGKISLIRNGSTIAIGNNGYAATTSTHVSASFDMDARDTFYFGGDPLANYGGGCQVSVTAEAESEHFMASLENVAPVKYGSTFSSNIANNTLVTVPFAVKETDDDSLWGGSIYTAKGDGLYEVHCRVKMPSFTGWTAEKDFSLRLYKNDSTFIELDYTRMQASPTNYTMSGQGSVKILLTKDDNLRIKVIHTHGLGLNLNGSVDDNYLSIEKVDQNATIGMLPTSFHTGIEGLDVFHVENFESLALGDITTGNNATFDNGGTLDGTLAWETTSPIAGTKTLKYTQGSSSLNDWFKSPLIALDLKQKANWTGAICYFTYDGADDDIAFVFYDDTNSNIISSSVDKFTSESGATRFAISVFIPSTSSNVSWGCHTKVANSGKILKLDDIEFTTDPFVYKELSNDSDWESVTITGSWSTNTTYTALGKQEGDVFRVRGEIAIDSGTPDAVGLTLNLPAGLVIDTSKVVSTAGNDATFGKFNVLDAGVGILGAGVIGYNTSTSLYMKALDSSTNWNSPVTISNVSPITFDNGDRIYFEFAVPIVGWTSVSEHVVTPSSVPKTYDENDVSITKHSSSDTLGAIDAQFLPYLTGDSKWRLKFNIQAAWTGTADTNRRLIIDGINVGFKQAISFDNISASAWAASNYIDEGGTTSEVLVCIMNTTVTGTCWYSGDIALAEKPTWADPVSSQYLAAAPGIKFQRKFLTASSVTPETMSDLTFSNLTIGRMYEITGKIRIRLNGSDVLAYVSVKDGSTQINEIMEYNNNAITNHISDTAISQKYVATATTLTFISASTSANAFIEGTGLTDGTFIELTEIPNHTETTEW